MYSTTQKKCSEQAGVRVYQCQELKRFSEAETFYKAEYLLSVHMVGKER